MSTLFRYIFVQWLPAVMYCTDVVGEVLSVISSKT